MNDKLSLYDIAELLSLKTGIERSDTEKFIIELITIINDGIRKDGIVKIKGFGTFKIILVKERESVHINTGERFVIPAHHKLSFKPEDELKDLINQPFSIFETIEAMDENITMDDVITNSSEENDIIQSDIENDGLLTADSGEDEPVLNISGDEIEEVDIIPPTEKITVTNDFIDEKMIDGEQIDISLLPVVKPLTVEPESNEKDVNPLPVDVKLQSDKTDNPRTSDQQPIKSNNSNNRKNKSSSLMPLYFILVFLVFVLAGCIWYYFAYNRSFDSFNKDYSTKISNNVFGLPGDSLSEQKLLEKSKVIPDDSLHAINSGNAGPANSEVQSTVTTDQNDLTVSNPVNNQSPSNPETSVKSQPSEETNKAKSKSPSKTGNVLAKVKIESGNRLTLIAEKYYGSKIFWVYIYDFNKEKIGSNPNNVRAGMEILVPAKETYGIDVNNANSREKAIKLQAQLVSDNR